MAVLLALLALCVIVAAVLLLRRRPTAGRLVQAPVDAAVVALPDGALTGADLRRVRFPLVVRGYRPADVDALLARLAIQLDPAPIGEVPADLPGPALGAPVADPLAGPAHPSADTLGDQR